MDHQKVARDILEYVGGEKNVEHVTHCYTRLRFNLVDNKKAERKKIESLEGVINVQEQSGQFQVVIGNEVAKVYKQIEEDRKSVV